MSKAPPIPREQRSFQKQSQPDLHNQDPGRRDRKTGLQSTQVGDGDVNLDQQGRQGNLHQNVSTVHARVQER